MISGSTRLAGVMGWPVAHSRSPAMHNAAYAALGMDWVYVPLPVKPEHLGDAVRGLRGLGFVGANVTVPHKQAVIPFLDALSTQAKAVRAVNTIVVRDDASLLGDTTDGYGFVADLREHAVPLPCRALVIGAGGAARSVVFALAEVGCAVTVTARNVSKAEELCQVVASALPSVAGSLRAAPFPAALQHVSKEVDLIVNATSLGLHEEDDLPWDRGVPLHGGQIVYDLIYHRPTPFLRLAREQGARAIDGLGMLVHQGARSFELWTGVPAPVEVMAAAARGQTGPRSFTAARS